MIIVASVILVIALITLIVVCGQERPKRYSLDWWFEKSEQDIRTVVAARLVMLKKKGLVTTVYEPEQGRIKKVSEWVPLVSEKEIFDYINRPMEVAGQ